MNREIRILSTRKLKPNQKQFLLNAGFSVLEADFIRTTMLPFLLRDVSDNLIVTSQNAVKALAAHPDIQEIRRNPVFCVGEKTADLLDQTGFTVQETAGSAQELAEVIIANYSTESFTFFSGNIRRNELPMALLEADVELNEIEVYETDLTPLKVSTAVDGILFFSPSGVKSFLSANELESEAVFCIGETTAQSFSGSNRPNLNIVIANQHTVESTIAKCINYFNAQISPSSK